ncbi:MAG: pseudouridine synthase [Clostridium sp.]
MEERLQKYMAKCGVASRRKCEELILAGKVKVNSEIVTELGVKVLESRDVVEFENRVITPEERKRYIILNKPEGYITSSSDEKGRKTILDIVKVQERIYPIGRLDYDSSGLLLLTNDGDIYNKIIHPRVELDKKYIAVCDGAFTESDIAKFKTGINIEGYVTAPAEIRIISVDASRDKRFSNDAKISTVEITIHEGKNRQVRKMCEALNVPVLTLKRVSVGELELGYLKRGEFRELTENELKYIMSL